MHKSIWYSCWKFMASKHNVQFILDPYVVASYCTSYLTKKNQIVTKMLKNIIISCNEKIMKHILTFETWEMFFLMINKCQHN